MDACSVDIPDRWHRYGLLLGLLRARLGRILVLGSGGERVADAVAGRHGAAAFGCGDGKAQRIENLDPAAGDPCVLFVPDRHLLGAVGGAHVRACFCQRPSTRRVYSGHPGAFHRRWFDAVCLARANAKGGRSVRSDLARGRSRPQQPLPDNCLPHRFCWHTLSLALEAVTGDKISVGAPFFNLTFAPLFIPLLLAMPFGPLMAWKRGDILGAAQRLMVAFGMAIVVIIPTFAAGDRRSVLAPFGIGFATFVMIGAVIVIVA